MRDIHKISFTFAGHDYQAEVLIEGHYDKTYGADADGNRAFGRYVIDRSTVLWVLDILGNKAQTSTAMIDYILEKAEQCV